jgi:hypothetical protein
MLKALFTLSLFLFSISCMKSQDTLFRKDGTVLRGKIISTGDTVQYTDINGTKGSIQWVRMVDLSAIHFADGKQINLGIDPRQNHGKIFIKCGASACNERRTVLPRVEAAYSVAGYSISLGVESKKFGTNKRWSLDGEAGLIQKGGYAHAPNFVHDKYGSITVGMDPNAGEKVSYFSCMALIKYNIYKGFYVKSGLAINQLVSYKVQVIPYYSLPADTLLRSGLDAYYFKTTCSIVYGIGFVTLPKRVGFLMELCGITDLSPMGVTTEYRPKYFGNSFLLNIGMFINLYKEKK